LTNVFSMALESKGSGASSKRTYFLCLAMGRQDWLVLAVLAALLVGALLLRFAGFGGLEGVTI